MSNNAYSCTKAILIICGPMFVWLVDKNQEKRTLLMKQNQTIESFYTAKNQ